MLAVYTGNCFDDKFSHHQLLKFTLVSLAKGNYQVAVHELRETRRKAEWEINLCQIREELTLKQSSFPSAPEGFEE